MKGCRVYSFVKCFSHNQSSSRGFVIPFSTSSSNHLDQKWRRERKLPLNPNTSRDLRDAPDYSFLDGRPVPIGSRMKSRLEKQKKVAKMFPVIDLTQEEAETRCESVRSEASTVGAPMINQELLDFIEDIRLLPFQTRPPQFPCGMSNCEGRVADMHSSIYHTITCNGLEHITRCIYPTAHYQCLSWGRECNRSCDVFLSNGIEEKIVTLSREMDFAVERYKALQKANEAERQRKLDSKLKPKGHRMLQEK